MNAKAVLLARLINAVDDQNEKKITEIIFELARTMDVSIKAS